MLEGEGHFEGVVEGRWEGERGGEQRDLTCYCKTGPRLPTRELISQAGGESVRG